MTNEEKIKKIQAVIDHPGTERIYYGLLEDLGDLKGNYTDYMTTEPIKCNEELQRVKNADYAMKFRQLLSNIDASNSYEVLEETGDLKTN